MPNPKLSTEVKKLKGTLRPCRENPDEPKLNPSIPDMPEGLTLSAKAYWPLIIAHLKEMATLTNPDQYAVASLCQALGDLRDARKALYHRKGLTYTTDKGVILPWPELALIAAADGRVYKWISKLGLTPSDRSKVSSVKDASEENDLDWLN